MVDLVVGSGAEPGVLWRADEQRRSETELWRFADHVGLSLATHTYGELHDWSVRCPGDFWRAVWEFCDGIGSLGPQFLTEATAPSTPRPGLEFFAESGFNIAENYLRPLQPGSTDGPRADAPRADDIALVFEGEGPAANPVQLQVTHGELRAQVAAVQRALAADGVAAGDRVATMLPNGPAALVVFLAAASLGAVYSSVSPDFGTQGVLDRFGQIGPKVLVAADGYFYADRWHATASKAAEVAAGLAAAGTPLTRLVIAPYDPRAVAQSCSAQPATAWADWLAPHQHPPGSPQAEVAFERFGFDQPVYILYSSGTTGKPKCIVHRAGGALLKLLSEQRLHFDVRPGDRIFYFTTTGWMMWNWLVAGLAAQASLVLYDGSPFHPNPARLFDLADRWGVTLFGVSAKFIEGAMKAGLRPAGTHDLTSVRAVASTGSPLAPEGFDWVYEHVKPDVHLASFSGGTDICGGFVIGDPTGPVRRGEIQVPALGLDVDVADASGGRCEPGAQGELVCRNAFVSMPLRFWNDPSDARYRAAYFERYPGLWHHGDFAHWTAGGGMVISGRSDATLNPGGVRIGTAEIYRQVDQIDEVLESVAIGQRVPSGDSAASGSQASADVRVVLFVKLRDGTELSDELIGRIRRQIRSGASPRHVPAVVAQVPAIPRTRSGKLVELAIRDVVEGRAVTNAEAIDDPAALDHFADHPALRT